MKNLKIMSMLLGGLLALGSFPSCSSILIIFRFFIDAY